MNVVLSVGNVLSSTYNVWHDREKHQKSLRLEQELHDKEIKCDIEFHKDGIITDKRLYLVSILADVEAYCQTLNADLVNSTMEADRDMVDQKNQQYQTMLIATTIMLGASIGTLFQAPLPADSDEIIIIVYAVSLALSISILTFALCICLKILRMISQFMYENSKAYFRHCNKMKEKADEHTRKLPRKASSIRFATTNNLPPNPPPTPPNNATTQSVPSSNIYGHLTSVKSIEQLQEHWEHHEETLFTAFRERYIPAVINGTENNQNENNANVIYRFSEFWPENGKNLGRLVQGLFYSGTICMLVGIAAYCYALFDVQFQCIIASRIACCVIGSSVLAMAGIVNHFKKKKPVKEE